MYEQVDKKVKFLLKDVRREERKMFFKECLQGVGILFIAISVLFGLPTWLRLLDDLINFLLGR